jgi:coenzyme F420-0:L-glutamate ligase/coenzyme F420-1:gamma-L-glutamate ligase
VIVRDLVELACAAPAPHGARPWRFVYLSSAESRQRLGDAMAGAWLADLVTEDVPAVEVDRLFRRSMRQLTEAPVLLLSCIIEDESRAWPDERRRRAERDMFVQSLGAALQNMLLAAVERGLAGYIKGAPLFCQDAVTDGLELPEGWTPAFLVLLGYPDPAVRSPERPRLSLEDVMTEV